MERHEYYIQMAIDLAVDNVDGNNGGPFGAIVVKDGEVIAKASNKVTCLNDPTAHAEINAIRQACATLGSHQLEDCVIYSSCEPCPMCLGAIYWARPKALYFSASRADAADAGFDDSMIYEEFQKDNSERKITTIKISSDHSGKPFEKWKMAELRHEY